MNNQNLSVISLYSSKVDGSGSDSEHDALRNLRESLGDYFVNFLLEKFESEKNWKIRCSCVFYAIRYASTNPMAVKLGLLAIRDKSKIVRYRGCMLLAFSQRLDLLSELEEYLKTVPQNSRDDLVAAIDAVKNQNRHLFADRKHTGKIKLNLADDD